MSLDSVPEHATSSNKIGAVPCPKYAPVRAIEPDTLIIHLVIAHSFMHVYFMFYQMMRVPIAYRQL